MGIEAKIINKLDKDNVCVEIKSEKYSKPKYYKVSEKNADSFINEYKKNDKKTSIIANTTFVSSVFAGVIIAGLATKNLKNKLLKWIIGSAGGVIGATLSIIGTGNYIESSKDKLLKEQKVKELNYNA